MDISDELQKQTESARLHNIDAEEVMGMFSAGKERANNATIGFLSARMRARKNSVVSYLDSLTEEKRQSAIDFAVGMARKRRRDNRIGQKDIQEEMSSRAKQKRDDKDRKSIESKLKEAFDIKSEFPDLAIEKISDLVDILTGKVAGRCVASTFIHL